MSKFIKFKKNIEINGESVFKYVGQLDYTLNQNERIGLVYNLLCDSFGDGYMAEYLPKEYFSAILSDEINSVPILNVCLNQSDCLSEDEPFFKAMQRFVNYILYAPDSQKIDKKTVQYNFYSDAELFKKAQREKSLQEMEDGGIDFLLQPQQNFKKDKNIKQGGNFNWLQYARTHYNKIIPKAEKTLENIKKTLKNDEKTLKNHEFWKLVEKQEYVERKLRLLNRDKEIMFADLYAYQKLINNCSATIREVRAVNKDLDKFDAVKLSNDALLRKLSNIRNSYYEQQKMIFEAYAKLIYFKSPLKDEGSVDYDMFNFYNEHHVAQLLRMSNAHKEDILELIFELEKYLECINLTEQEKKMLVLVKFNNLSDAKIEESLGMAKMTLGNSLMLIAKRVVKVAKESFINNVYYVQYEKGTYKKCSKCGEVILTRYFGKRTASYDGLFPSCTKCRAK